MFGAPSGKFWKRCPTGAPEAPGVRGPGRRDGMDVPQSRLLEWRLGDRIDVAVAPKRPRAPGLLVMFSIPGNVRGLG